MEPSKKVRRMPCPPNAAWVSLAAGSAPEADAESLIAHASECPDCARTLRAAIDALDDDVDVDDLTTPEIQTLAARMARAAGGNVGRRAAWSTPWQRWAAIGTVAAALMAGWWSWHRQMAAPPLTTLAVAYAKPRTLEFRIVGGVHAPLRVNRGTAGGPGVSPEVLESQALILKATNGKEPTADWLHAKGRAELLQGDFEGAIRSLQTAADLGAVSAEFWNDFGIAYAMRADAHSAPVDSTKAIELFTAGLATDPRNPALLFNRALSESKFSLIEAAIRDLESCLAAEKEAGWRGEASALLEELRRKKSGVVEAPGRPLPEALWAEVEFEELLRNGLLPLAQSERVAPVLARVHGDRWLTEAVALKTGTATEKRAVAALSAMARIRSKARREQYAPMSGELAWLAKAALSEPLAAWRNFELLARESNRPGKTRCLAQWADRHGGQPGRLERYRWFAIQSALEVSTCYSAEGNLDSAAQSTARALELAGKATFGTALIRAKGFLASHLSNEGRYREAIATSNAAIAEILSGRYPLDRAYQFYRNLAASCERLERWQTATAAREMAVVLARSAGLVTLEAIGLLELAEDMLRTGDRAGARAQIRAAESLAARFSPDSDTSLYRSFAASLLGALEGDYASTLAVEKEVLGNRNLFVDARYLNQVAELELRLGHVDAARQHAFEAIRRIEAQPGEGRRFRNHGAQASRALVKAHLARQDYRAALQTWRDWLRRDRDLLGGRKTFFSPAKPGARTLTIVPLDDRLGIFLERGDSLEFRWSHLVARDGIRLVRKLRALCASFQSDPERIRAVAAELASGLVGNWAVRWEEPLRLEATGEWASIPLALLNNNGSAGIAFRAPGPARADCAAYRGQLAVIQANVIDAEAQVRLPRLPGLEREQRLLRGLAANSLLLSGHGATPSALARAGAEYRWLHFSGHALRVRESIKLLAAPDPSSAEEGARRGFWDLGPADRVCSEMVFFAACATAEYRDAETISPVQLGEAAIVAGARSVVAALWDVDSQATTELAVAFYSAMGSGLDPAGALRQAARHLREDARYRHPYYWAAFVVFEV